MDNQKTVALTLGTLGAAVLLYYITKPKNAYKTIQPIEAKPQADKKLIKAEIVDLNNNISKITQNNFETLKKLGNEAFKYGKFKQALDYYNQALSSTQNIQLQEKAKIYQNLGAVYQKMKNLDQSLTFCIKAVELDSGYTKAWERIEKLLSDNLMEFKTPAFEMFEILMAVNIKNQLSKPTLEKAADVILKSLSMEASKNTFNSHVMNKFPNEQFIKNYFSTFLSFKECNFYKILACHDGSFQDYYENLIKFYSTSESESSSENLLIRGTLNLLTSNFTQAIKDFEKVVTPNSNNQAITTDEKLYGTIQLANSYTQVGIIEAATLYFNKAQNLNDKNFDLYYHKATMLTSLQKPEDALICFQKCVKINPEFDLAFAFIYLLNFQIGTMTNNTETVNKSIQNFKSGIEKWPKCSEMYDLYAQVEQARGNFENAINLYEKSFSINKKNANALVHKANLIYSMGDKQQALELLTHIIQNVDDKNDYCYETLGKIFSENGNLVASIAAYENAIKYASTRQELFTLFANLFTLKAKVNVHRKYRLRLEDLIIVR